jgi:hypothetical protein
VASRKFGLAIGCAKALSYEPKKHTAWVEQAKRRRRAYGTHIKGCGAVSGARMTEFSESWVLGLARGCDD